MSDKPKTGLRSAAPSRIADAPASQELSLRVESVSKRFGATIALSEFSMTFAPGRVYAVLGENGSGKSTLVKTLSGVLRPDRGSVRVGDVTFARYTPAEAIACGVATAHQEILVAKNLTVLENLYLWDRGWPSGSVQAAERRRAGELTLAELCDNPPSLMTRVGSLSLASQQSVVIARTALQPSQIVILDEATSALDAYDAGRLLEWIRRRASEGGTVLFISHRLGEVANVADEVVILREGALVGTMRRDEFSPQAALALMSPERDELGRTRARSPDSAVGAVDLRDGMSSQQATAVPPASRIRAVGLVLRAGADPIDLDICCGEVTGFAGLDGHGQAEVLQQLSGWARPAAGHVEVVDEAGRARVVHSFRGAAALGVAYVPRDRKADGILPSRSVFENFALAMWGDNAVAGVIRPSRLRSDYERFVSLLSIKSSGPRARITSLSGGGQQKVIVARWLARKPRVLLLDDPTRGVDQATKVDLYVTLERTARAGSAVVIVSTDADELATLCDRVIVFYRSRVMADLRGEGGAALAPDEIVEAMFGERADGDGADE